MVFVRGHALGFDEFILQHLKGLVIQLELKLQRAVGDPSSLSEERQDLVEHCVKIHHRPSTCASAASASGSQKVMSMVRYSLIAGSSSARASAWRPIVA